MANGRYIEDTTTGSVAGKPYWRRGWLGYSNMDHRYEWVTIDSLNTTMMIYLGKPGSGKQSPIDLSGVFTDQGVVNEQTVGKPVAMRTVIRIESNDRHIFELRFTAPGGKEQLADAPFTPGSMTLKEGELNVLIRFRFSSFSFVHKVVVLEFVHSTMQ